jgi:hypothetical protein
MRSGLRWCAGLLFLAATLHAQTDFSKRYQFYGGYTFLSNSLNGVSGSTQPLNGYEIALAIPPWHDLRFKLNMFQYRGTNLGAVEHPYFIMGGGQYGRNLGKESLFVEGLFGEAGVNQDWGANKTIGPTASIAAIVGGGVDTPLSPHFAFRVEGDYLYTYFKQVASRNPLSGVPVYVPGMPTNFARISTGIVCRF